MTTNELNDALNSLFVGGPIISQSTISQIGHSLIIAPHPDDESLACGGTIALLRKNNYMVHVIFVTDGSMSHPNSKKYPPVRLKNLREEEAIRALEILGVPPNYIYFLRLPDSKVSTLSTPIYKNAIETTKDIILQVQPDTIFVPWRKDPHPDHVGSWHLLKNALKKVPSNAINPPNILEYLVWFWERTNLTKLSPSQTTKIWRVKVTSALSQKVLAIKEHKSQLGGLIDDDPAGFSLPTDLLKKMHQPEEVYLEYSDYF